MLALVAAVWLWRVACARAAAATAVAVIVISLGSELIIGKKNTEIELPWQWLNHGDNGVDWTGWWPSSTCQYTDDSDTKAS